MKVICQFQGISTETSAADEAKSLEPEMGGKVREVGYKVIGQGVTRNSCGRGCDDTRG